VLDLTKLGPADLGELAGLSPRLAVAYAGKTAKTLTREQRWCANADIIRAVLPRRRRSAAAAHPPDLLPSESFAPREGTVDCRLSTVDARPCGRRRPRC